MSMTVIMSMAEKRPNHKGQKDASDKKRDPLELVQLFNYRRVSVVMQMRADRLNDCSYVEKSTALWECRLLIYEVL